MRDFGRFGAVFARASLFCSSFSTLRHCSLVTSPASKAEQAFSVNFFWHRFNECNLTPNRLTTLAAVSYFLRNSKTTLVFNYRL